MGVNKMIYLVRHGDALSNIIDTQRALSETGIYEVSKIAKELKIKNIHVKTIYHSGKLRAEQTADILNQHIQANQGIRQKKGLCPSDDIDVIINTLLQEEEEIMLVGHLPFMNNLASRLTSIHDYDERISFTTATILCLERNGVGWEYKWKLTPFDIDDED